MQKVCSHHMCLMVFRKRFWDAFVFHCAYNHICPVPMLDAGAVLLKCFTPKQGPCGIIGMLVRWDLQALLRPYLPLHNLGTTHYTRHTTHYTPRTTHYTLRSPRAG